MQLFVWIFFYVSRIIEAKRIYHFCWWSDVFVTYPFYRSLLLSFSKRYTWKRNHFTSIYLYVFIYTSVYIHIYICIYHTRTNDIVGWKTRTTEESVARSGDRPLRLAERSVTDWATDSPTPLVPSKREPRMAERGRGSPILRLVAPKAPIFASLSLQLSRYRPYT